MDSKTKYVTFIEQNEDEKECFIIYIKYNGNEEALAKLDKVIERADDLQFSLDLEHFISESSVKEHLELKYGGYNHMFTVANGKLELPLWMDEYEEMSQTEIILHLDNDFYKTHIHEFFS